MNLASRYLGLALPHPIVAGASPLSGTLDGILRLEDAGAAAIVTASAFEEEIEAADAALASAASAGADSHPEAMSYFIPAGGYRGALDAHLQLIRRAGERVSVPLIASLNATTRDGWTVIATALEAAGAAALELNPFHLPADPQESPALADQRLVDTVQSVCTSVSIPVSIKLSPNLSAPAQMVASLHAVGAAGAVVFGRAPELDIDLGRLAWVSPPRLSSADEIRFPLMWLALLAGTTPLSLAAGRGVESAVEVIKYLLAGADVVQTASSLLRNGPAYIGSMIESVAEWLDARGATSLADIRGRMRLTPSDGAEEIVRGQAIQAFRAKEF